MNHKRIERLWRREGLKVPREQPKRRQLWLNDGSCVPLRPLHKDHNVGTVLVQFAIVLIILWFIPRKSTELRRYMHLSGKKAHGDEESFVLFSVRGRKPVATKQRRRKEHENWATLIYWSAQS